MIAIALLLGAGGCRRASDPTAARPSKDQVEPDDALEPPSGSGGPGRPTVAPDTAGKAATPNTVPTELARALDRAAEASKLAADAPRRVEVELNLRVYEEAAAGFEACISELGGLFARLPESRRYRVPGRKRTALGLQRDCQAGLARLSAEKQSMGKGLEKRVRAQLEKEVDAIDAVRKDLAQARRLRGRDEEIDAALSSVIERYNRIVARYDAGFKSFPDLKDALIRGPASGPRGRLTMVRLRDEIMREGERVARERAKLRAARDTRVRRTLVAAMRGLSSDQRRVVEQHLAMPDERRPRRAGGVCFVYRGRETEQICFDRSGRQVPGT